MLVSGAVGPQAGARGLSRAYGAAARQCLQGADRKSGSLVTFEESCVVEVVVAVDAVGGAYRASLLSASGGGGEGIQEEYGNWRRKWKRPRSLFSSSSLASGTRQAQGDRAPLGGRGGVRRRRRRFGWERDRFRC